VLTTVSTNSLGMSGADNNRKRKRVDGELNAFDSSILV
jgi:hypothetical protein